MRINYTRYTIVILCILLLIGGIFSVSSLAIGQNAKSTVVSPAKPITDVSKLPKVTRSMMDAQNPQSPLFNKSILPLYGPANFGQNNTIGKKLYTSSVTAAANPDHFFYGTYIFNSATVIAVYAIQQIQPSYQVTNGNLLYAPTICGPLNCPLEAVTTYTNGNLYFGVWDHTVENFIRFDQIDSNWKNKYVRNINGLGNAYQVEIVTDGGSQWWVGIYNYQAGHWDWVNYVNHNMSPQMGHGWDFWEAYYYQPYPTSQPPIESQWVQEYDTSDHNWHLVDTMRGFVDTSVNPPMAITGFSYQMIALYHDWKVWR